MNCDAANFGSWKGKVFQGWSSEGKAGGTILQIAAHESWFLRTGEEEPLWAVGLHPDSCPGMQPFIETFLRTFGSLIEEGPRQKLLDFLPRALSTHDFDKHGVNNIAEGKRCTRAMNATLKLVQEKRPGPVIASVEPCKLVDTINDRVTTLYELAQHLNKERVFWALYETWWGGMHNVIACAHNAAIVFSALDVEAGMTFLDKIVEPNG